MNLEGILNVTDLNDIIVGLTLEVHDCVLSYHQVTFFEFCRVNEISFHVPRSMHAVMAGLNFNERANTLEGLILQKVVEVMVRLSSLLRAHNRCCHLGQCSSVFAIVRISLTCEFTPVVALVFFVGLVLLNLERPFGDFCLVFGSWSVHGARWNVRIPLRGLG